MRQILHIFRKDLRHFWPETLVVVALSVAFALIWPHSWFSTANFDETSTGFHLNFGQWQILATTVAVLLPVSWLILIVRVTHEENLVGNRQFWITRPYLWPELVAEKSLYFAVFILGPYIAAQVVLLHHVGFWARNYPGGIAFSTFIMLGIAVLPFFALASVVSTLVRIFGVLLSIVMLVLAAAFVASTFHSTSKPDAYTPYHDVITLPSIAVLCGAVLLIQYSSRKLWLSRSLLIAVPLSVTLLVAAPWEKVLQPHYYPVLSTNEAPLQVRLAKNGATTYTVGGANTGLLLPFNISGVESGTALSVENMRVLFDTPDGAHDDSDWQATNNNDRLFSPGGQTQLGVQIDRSFLDKHAHKPMTLHVELAFTQFVAGTSSTTKVPGGTGTFSVESIGICSRPYLDAPLLECREPFHQPHLALVSALDHEGSCKLHPDAPAKAVTSWIGSLANEPADVSFSPIQTTSVDLSLRRYVKPGQKPPVPNLLCADAPVTFTRFNLLRRFSVHFTEHDVLLSESAPLPDME